MRLVFVRTFGSPRLLQKRFKNCIKMPTKRNAIDFFTCVVNNIVNIFYWTMQTEWCNLIINDFALINREHFGFTTDFTVNLI